jgi:hypothetical protein
MIYFGFRTLQEQLKLRRLPSSRPFITTLENKGKINKPQNTFRFHKADIKGHLSKEDIRIYTMDEIYNICDQIDER